MALTPDDMVEIALAKAPYVIGLGAILYFGLQILRQKQDKEGSGARVGQVG